jgi:hypothetical protein
MSEVRSNAFDTPPAVINEIFGSSTDEGDADERIGALAELVDCGDHLRLTLTDPRTPPDEVADGSLVSRTVADIAEADREITIFLGERPGVDVLRTGDGWVTHSE